MRFLQRISIKNFLMGAIGFLLLALTWLSANNVWNTYKYYEETSRVDTANELSDSLLEASGYEAKERGVTAMVLSSDKPADGSIIQKIQDIRTKGDEAIGKAFTLSKELMKADESNTLLNSSAQELARLQDELVSIRKLVDREIGNEIKTYASKDWIKLITTLIDSNSDTRLAAFASNKSRDTNQEALRMNIELKQAVWLVSEYAGRERAALAPFISTNRPLDPETAEKLNTFKAVVGLNTKHILKVKEMSGIDHEVISAIEKMESVYLGSFADLRATVYAQGATGSYPVNGKEWVEKSSEGIDTILAVSAAVGKMVDNKVMADLAASKRHLAFSAVALAATIIIAFFSFYVIKHKVVSPMLYLSDTVSNIEKTNDLTLDIEVKSEDESGQIATAFNRMINKFHGIIADLHSSIEHLASSSEELSASAVQIAGGSQSQSARASQVSTAAQEMSATIIEVAKNVSGAAEAAKEASSVALKGGEIVSRTIQSMNGIAVTAKDSSQIISKLGGRSQEIGNIVNVIDDIADQTNLLALNAAIEAARAGEQGRGFAVVADEVRKLAEKTMKATKEIGEMIRAMQDETGKAIESMQQEVKAVESGVKLAKEAGGALNEIVHKVDTVTSMIHQITTATEQQSAATEQISVDIESVADVINETSATAQQIAKASQEMAELATNLKTTVEVFKISGNAKETASNSVTKPGRALKAA